MILGGTYKVDYAGNEPYRLYPIGDIHWGARGVDKKGLRNVIQKVAEDDRALWIGMGDYIDGVNYTDPRFDPDLIDSKYRIKNLSNLGQREMEDVKDLFLPIKDKCIGLLTGNHEAKYDSFNDHDLHGWLCTELGALNLGYCSFRDIVLRGRGGKDSTKARIWCHHGAGCSEKKLLDYMGCFDADIYLMGHIHKQEKGILKKEIISAGRNATRIEKKTKIGIITPSYLDGYTVGKQSYVEKAGYMPCTLGRGLCVKIYPKTGQLGLEE